ncbi:MAG: ester cyclase [Deltaproteobacteria bacterium]|nr:ester cyclase [Deltaproteobacteria bacterium]
MTTAEQHKAHIRRYFAEIVSKGNLEAIPDFVAPHIVFRGPYTSEPVRGIEAFKELIAMLHAAFSDLQITEEDMVVEGDTVATRWTASGIHRGEFIGTGPSGKPFRFTGTAFYRIADGKIVEGWAVNNSLEIVRELSGTATTAADTAAKRRAQLRAVADAYFAALGKKDFAAIPYDDHVSLRTPLCPGGVHTPLVGKEALRTMWWPPLVPVLGEVKVLEHYINEDMTAICTEALISTVSPPATLRVADRFTVNTEGKIIEQENHFDPRDVTNPGWQKSSGTKRQRKKL